MAKRLAPKSPTTATLTTMPGTPKSAPMVWCLQFNSAQPIGRVPLDRSESVRRGSQAVAQ